MSTIRLHGFSGIAPKLDPVFLKPHQSQVAINSRLDGGALRAWRSNSNIAGLDLASEIKTIYQMPAGEWLQFNQDVDIVKSQLADDATDRHYFTGTDVPRVTNNTLVDSSAPSSGTVDGATQANPCVLNDTAHGLFTGAKITPSDVGGMVEINDIEFTVTVIDADNFSLDGIDSTAYTAFSSAGTWARTLNEFPEDSYVLGVPAPTTAPTATLVSGAPVTPVDTAYVYTFVNAWGEESAPSPVSNIVACDFDVESIDLTTMDAAPTGDYVPISSWRIYRVASGTVGAEYLFVAEVTINTSSPQYNDSILTDALVEVIPTEDWNFPPSGLIGLTEMANGIFAGFVGNKVYFCEPYVPYAWPEKYSYTVPFDIVGLGSFGSTLVVMTKSRPYTITGTTPESMSPSKLPERQACVSKRSIVSFGLGVAYACPDGVYYIGEDGKRLLTEHYYTRKEWQDLVPTASHAERYDGNYVIFFTQSKTGLLIDPETGPTTLSIDADAVWSDDEGDRLYMAIYDDVALTTNINEFNAGGGRLVYTWRSKRFIMPQLLAMTSCKMNADYDATLSQTELDELQAERDALEILNAALISSGDLCSSINGNQINEYPVNGDCLWILPTVPVVSSYVLKIYGDDNLLVEQTVNSVAPFRVNIEERYNDYEIEISGQYPVRDVVLATSIRELKAYAA